MQQDVFSGKKYTLKKVIKKSKFQKNRHYSTVTIVIYVVFMPISETAIKINIDLEERLNQIFTIERTNSLIK